MDIALVCESVIEDLSWKMRWIESNPDSSLTWGEYISGDSFISKAKRYGIFHEKARILEVGSGYGRLLSSMLSMKVAFEKFTGLDISEQNIVALRQKFADESRVDFVRGDAESAFLSQHYTAVVSSLTLKHFYPTFESGLANISNYVTRDGVFFFDLLERKSNQMTKLVKVAVTRPRSLRDIARNGGVLDADGRGYIRSYGRNEVASIMRRIGFGRVTFDDVLHDTGRKRLLVIASRVS